MNGSQKLTFFSTWFALVNIENMLYCSFQIQFEIHFIKLLEPYFYALSSTILSSGQISQYIICRATCNLCLFDSTNVLFLAVSVSIVVQFWCGKIETNQTQGTLCKLVSKINSPDLFKVVWLQNLNRFPVKNLAIL